MGFRRSNSERLLGNFRPKHSLMSSNLRWNHCCIPFCLHHRGRNGLFAQKFGRDRRSRVGLSLEPPLMITHCKWMQYYILHDALVGNTTTLERQREGCEREKKGRKCHKNMRNWGGVQTTNSKCLATIASYLHRLVSYARSR